MTRGRLPGTGMPRGHFRDHHGYLLRMMLDHVDALTAQVEDLTGRIGGGDRPFLPPGGPA
jgi:hypothetical protein